MISERVGVITLPMAKRDLLHQNQAGCATSPWGPECSDYLGCSGCPPRAWTMTSATGQRTAAEISSVPEMAGQAVREVAVFQLHIYPPFEGAVARP